MKTVGYKNFTRCVISRRELWSVELSAGDFDVYLCM